METLQQVVDLLAAGNWQEAHAIVQNDASPHGAWAHGIVHLMEGDRRNASYWYRRAGRDMPSTDAAIAREIAALRSALGSPTD